MNYTEIEKLDQFLTILISQKEFKYYAFQNIDFTLVKENFEKIKFLNCIFLGCKFHSDDIYRFWPDNDIFPNMVLPFNQHPSELYHPGILYDHYITGSPDTYKDTYDCQVYNHYLRQGKEATSIKETLARRLHDHAVTDALYDFLANYPEKKIVAIMGGHNISRMDRSYKKVALLSKKLCEMGYLMITGGGPGAMEATHLGAWFAGRMENEFDDAISILEKAPDYQHKFWLDSAFQVITKYPQVYGFESVGIPTWLYGHEPATPFATKIAKYFENSIREDGLLTIAKGGIIFTPGSAGTIQEIFQEATQNHYVVFGYASPMIFFGHNFWTNEVPVYPFIKKLVGKGKYQNLILSIADSDDEIIRELEKFSGY